jgi:hypothetical protein
LVLCCCDITMKLTSLKFAYSFRGIIWHDFLWCTFGGVIQFIDIFVVLPDSCSKMDCWCHLPSPVACPAVRYISTLSYKMHEFGIKVFEHEISVLICSTKFVWNISYSKENWTSYDKKYLQVFIYCAPCFCEILMAL